MNKESKPSLQDIVAAFRAKQNEETEAKKQKKRQEDAREQAYRDARFAVVDELRESFQDILRPLIQSGDAEVGLVVLKDNGDTCFTFRTRRPGECIRWDEQRCCAWANNYHQPEIRWWCYRLYGNWNQTPCGGTCTDKAELLLMACEGAGRLMAKLGK